MNVETVVYKSAKPISGDREYLAFLVVDAHQIDGKRRTGKMVKDTLSVVFYGITAEAAVSNALAFWEAETAKAKARVEMGKKLGESRKKNA